MTSKFISFYFILQQFMQHTSFDAELHKQLQVVWASLIVLKFATRFSLAKSYDWDILTIFTFEHWMNEVLLLFTIWSPTEHKKITKLTTTLIRRKNYAISSWMKCQIDSSLFFKTCRLSVEQCIWGNFYFIYFMRMLHVFQ